MRVVDPQVDHPNICRIHEVIDVTASDTLLVGEYSFERGKIETHDLVDSTRAL